MARSIDRVLWAEWRERLGRFDSCGLTVVEFCRSEKVSQAAFYVWRKKLGPDATADTNQRRMNSSLSPDRQWLSTFLPVVSSVPIAVRDAAFVVMTLPNGVRFELPTTDRGLMAQIVELATGFAAVASSGVVR